MNNLQVTARYKIHPGKLEEFKILASQCMAIVREKDLDTLQYDWFISEDQTECNLRESYPNSDALLAHLANIGDLFGKLVALGDFKAEIYGTPSEELLKATAGLRIELYSFYQGLDDDRR